MKAILISFLLAATISISLPSAAQKKINTVLAAKIDSLAGITTAEKQGNLPHLKGILDQYGFPGVKQVGVQSSRNYWMLVQQCNNDREFQKAALKAMKKQVTRQNASAVDYASLVDEIELQEGRPQIYGTQVEQRNGLTITKKTFDLINVDTRRASIGLESLRSYLDKANATFRESEAAPGHQKQR